MLLLVYACSPAMFRITVMLLVVDAALTCIIVAKVPYTEIDWRAYMQEVEGVCDLRNAANTAGNAIAHV